MRQCGIYKLTSPSGKIYIGQSLNIHKRMLTYKAARTHRQTALHSAILKYGFNSFKVEIIALIDASLSKDKIKEQLNALEEAFIKQFSCTFPNGYNLRSGGNSSFHSEESKAKMRIVQKGKNIGRIHTPEAREKMSKALKGREFSKEHRHKLSERMKGTKMSNESLNKMIASKKGGKLADEHKLAISTSLKKRGYKMSDDNKRKLILANKGRKLTSIHKEKLSNANKGRIIPNEHRKKLSEALIGRKMSDEMKAKISNAHKVKRKIIDTSTGAIYNTVKEAAFNLKLNYATLKSYLNGNNKKETTFKYILNP